MEYPKATSMIDKAVETSKAMIKRFLLHILVLTLCAVFIEHSIDQAMFVYVGGMCLVPRSFNLKSKFFLFPFAVSIVQFVVYALFYNFWTVGLLWAGVQTWVLRGLYRKFKFDLDWLFFPFVLAAISVAYHDYGCPFLIFPVFTLVGYFGYKIAKIQEDKRNLDAALRSLLAYSEKALGAGYPTELSDQLTKYQETSVDVLKLGDINKSKVFPGLMPVLQEATNALTASFSWTAEDFKSAKANSLLASLSSVNLLLMQALGATGTDAKNAGGSSASEDPRFAPLYASARQLLEKKKPLPETAQANVQSIYVSTMSIIQCMATDPTDVVSGTRFLDRYLTAAHSVLDEYAKFKADTNHENVADVLAKSEALLERMAKAFHEEHGNLLRNDTMEFDADLNVLNKLLSMDGK